MPDMTVETAFELARKGHEDQRDKAGMPYFETHVLDVHQRVVAAGGDVDQQVAALLHDVLEDVEYTGTTEEDLRAAGISETALRLVKLLTKVEGVDAMDYLQQIAADAAARLVKLADIASNTDPLRLARLAPDVRRKGLVKYIGYVDALGGDASALRAAEAVVPEAETDAARDERIERVFNDRQAAGLHRIIEESDFTIHDPTTRR